MNKAKQRQSRTHKPQHLAYQHGDRREKNKAYKIIKHLERHPSCKTAIKALDNLPAFCVKAAREKLRTLRAAT